MNYTASIDWDWVMDSVLQSEKVLNIKDSSKKDSIETCVLDCLKIAQGKAAPKVRIVKKKILEFNTDSILLEDGISIRSKDVCRYLNGANAVYLFAVTIGDGPEKSATLHMDKGDALSGYLLDRIGSYACESLAESAENDIRKDCTLGSLSVSMRMSPGYCDWDVSDQLKMDKAIKFSKIGISLNNNFMMSPKKSITAIVGIGPKGMFKGGKSQCGECNKTDCYLRRVS